MRSTRLSYAHITQSVTEWIAVLLFSAVLIAQILNILFRYTKIHEPWMWVGELSRYAFIWIVFLLWHSCDRKGSHFVVDLVTAKAGGKYRLVLGLFARLATFLFAGLVIWASIQYVPSTMVYSTDSFRWLPMGVVYLVIPVGLLLVFIEQLHQTFKELRRDRREGSF